MTNEKRENRRTAYTKRIIRESLYELMLEKPLDKITVTQICEKADINRSTFYTYYTDIYDLHQKIIAEFFEIQKGVISATKKLLESKADITKLTVNDYFEIAYTYTITVKNNKELYKFIFNQNSTNSIHVSFGKAFYQMIYDFILPVFPEEHINDIKSSFIFIGGGTTSMLMDWIKKDCSAESKKIARSLAHYYYGVFNSFVQQTGVTGKN